MIHIEPVQNEPTRSPLERTSFTVQLTEAATQVHQVQSWTNPGREPIEAVYTFPVPLNAVLLGATLTTEGRELELKVMPRTQAERDYEQAVESEKAAYHIEEARPGLYTLSAGNLMPGQRAQLHLHWAMLNRWHQRGLNLRLPTTLTPRFGSDVDAGLGGASTPQHSWHVDNRCDVEVLIAPELADINWQCASHPFQVDHRGAQLRLHAADISMARDIVIRFEQRRELPDRLYWLADGDHALAMLSIHGAMPAAQPVSSRGVVVVVDCSGSMTGASIAQAREALTAIVDQLPATRQVALIRFGSSVEPLFDAPRRCDDTTRSALHQAAQAVDANMGGTNMDAALHAAVQAAAQCPDGADILLLTDGAIYQTENALAAVKGQGARVFTIGIGMAPNEEVVGRIAALADGHCEMVGPGEDIVGAVRDQFQRMQSGEPASVQVQWPAGAQPWSAHTRLYPGDASYLFARCPGHAAGQDLTMTTSGPGGGGRYAIASAPAPAGVGAATLVRLAAHEHLRQLTGADERLALATRYELLCDQTSLLVIDTQSATGSAFPHVVPVAHNLPEMAMSRSLYAPTLHNALHASEAADPHVYDIRGRFDDGADAPVMLESLTYASQAPDEDMALRQMDLAGAPADEITDMLRRANQRVTRKGLSSLTVSVLDEDLVDELQPELTAWIQTHGELMVVCGVLQLLAGPDSGVQIHPLIAACKVPPALRNALRSALTNWC